MLRFGICTSLVVLVLGASVQAQMINSEIPRLPPDHWGRKNGRDLFGNPEFYNYYFEPSDIHANGYVILSAGYHQWDMAHFSSDLYPTTRFFGTEIPVVRGKYGIIQSWLYLFIEGAVLVSLCLIYLANGTRLLLRII